MWGFSRKYNIPLKKVLDFSGPINFLGPSPKAVDAVKQHARLIRFYPDPNPVELKTEIAKYVGHGIDAANIILGNGSIELIYMITGIFRHKFKAVIPVPSFTEYEKAALRVGGEPVFVQLPENFALKTESIKKVINDETSILCICNPHSPSGTLYNKEMILDLVDFCQKKDVILSVDENYIEFTGKAQDITMASYVKDFENLFVIRSVTKFYGMPGIRLGYGVAAKGLIDALQIDRQPWSINSLAGFATLAAIKDTEFIENTKRTIIKERTQFAKMLSEIRGFHVFPSATNFLLVKILAKKITATALKEEMAKQGILIRDCGTFVGLDNSYFRVTVRSSKENLKLVKTLKEIVNI